MPGPYLGEIKLFSSGTPPAGWAACNGQLLSAGQYPGLFSLLGTTYGGNGTTTFALPDFRGRTPIHAGNGHVVGESGGAQTHTLTSAQMPAHTHALNGTNGNGATPNPLGKVLAAASNLYHTPAAAPTTLSLETIATAGGGQPHPNMQPFLALSFFIALQGTNPSPS
ncbi:MAG TPA: tail fiber protein [Longimicrobium sp.]|jgi:microcystin-dependent protein